MVLNHPTHAKIFAEVIKAIISLQNNALQRIHAAVSQLPPEKQTPLAVLLPSSDSEHVDVSLFHFMFSIYILHHSVHLLFYGK